PGAQDRATLCIATRKIAECRRLAPACVCVIQKAESKSQPHDPGLPVTRFLEAGCVLRRTRLKCRGHPALPDASADGDLYSRSGKAMPPQDLNSVSLTPFGGRMNGETVENTSEQSEREQTAPFKGQRSQKREPRSSERGRDHSYLDKAKNVRA